MLGRQLAVIDAINDGQVDALCRRRDQHPLRARGDMRFAAGAVGEEAGAFERDVDAVGLMRQLGGILLRGHLDALAVDDDVAAVGRDFARVLAVHAVAREQPGVGLGIRKVVHADQFEPAIRALEDRTGDQAADATETVDGNSRHAISLCFKCSSTRAATASGVSPKNA